MEQDYTFFPDLFLRAPYYSFALYDLERLPDVLADQAFRNAIYLASPGFYEVIEKKAFDFNRLSEKEKHTLYKYYNRMCFRPTPFGSFASFTTLNWHESGITRLRPNQEAALYILPDRQWSFMQQKAPMALEANIALNPLLYKIGRDFRFAITEPVQKGGYDFGISSFPALLIDSKIFSRFKKKPGTVTELADWLKSQADCSRDDALEYLSALLKSQVLLSALQASVIGADKKAQIHDMSGCLKAAADNLVAARRETTGIAQPFYAALERPLESGGPDAADQQSLEHAIRLLQRLAKPVQPPMLKQFAVDFEARFGMEPVPLLLAFDPDHGIPYGDMAASAAGEGLLTGIPFSLPENKASPIEQSPAHHWLFKSWLQTPRSDPYSAVQLTVNDASMSLDDEARQFPKTTSVIFRKTEAGLFIEQAGGIASVAIIGRFSAFSEQVHALCRRLAANEIAASPDVLFADIGQLSGTHIDNINRRKPAYDYEIPVNVVSNLPASQQIMPAELMVYLRHGQLVLFSVKHKKQVIPRLATAYNPQHNSLGMFRFLCDMQYQGSCANLTFDPEALFPGMGFYPRITYQNVILSLAKWQLSQSGIGALLDGTGPLAERILRFRERHHLPQKVSLGHSDQQLVFDLTNTDEAFFFTECLQGLKQATIYEFLPPGRSVKSAYLPLAGQFIGFLQHNGKPNPAPGRAMIFRGKQVKRDFMPGSDWLYLKWYCTPVSADKLLLEVVLPVLGRHRKMIKNWFFVRYAEGGNHLRLRFRINPEDAGHLLVSLTRQLTSSGHRQLVKNYQSDTYRREIERYGPGTIDILESLFEAGSELVISHLYGLQHEAVIDEWGEFRLAFATALRMVLFFVPDMRVAVAFTEAVCRQFLIEFKADKAMRVSLDTKFREMKGQIAGLEQIAPEAGLLQFDRALQSVKVSARGVDNRVLLADIIHMQMNRTFHHNQRKQELLVYYCLVKYLRSLKARK